MPVMVVGVENAVGRRAVELLVSRGGEVRVFVPAGEGGAPDPVDPQPFRAMGCKVAHGFLDDEAHVETALEQVHTVALLLGRPTDDPATYLDRAATVVGAAIGAGCRRLVVLSDLAAGSPAGNPWLEALAEVEEMAADAPMESVVLRAALVWAEQDPLTVALAAGALGDAPAGSHWPVHADDVAVVAALVDEERDLDSSLHVLLPVAGPEEVPTAMVAERLAGIVPAVAGDALPDHAVDLLARQVRRPEDAVGASGRRLGHGAGGTAGPGGAAGADGSDGRDG